MVFKQEYNHTNMTIYWYEKMKPVIYIYVNGVN